MLKITPGQVDGTARRGTQPVWFQSPHCDYTALPCITLVLATDQTLTAYVPSTELFRISFYLRIISKRQLLLWKDPEA